MKIFGILLFLVSYNCFSEPLTVTYPDGVSITLGDTQPLSEKVDELNKCIKKVKAANTQYKKNRKSKGPLSKLFSVVDKIRFDRWTKIMIGVMEEVRFGLTGSINESHVVSGNLSKKKIKKLEKKFNNSYFSKKFAKNKKYYRKTCVEENNISGLSSQERAFSVQQGVYDTKPIPSCKQKYVIDVTPSEVHRIIKRRPNTFCETRNRYVFDDIKMEDNVNNSARLVRWSQDALTESHSDIRSEAIYNVSYRDYGHIIWLYRVREAAKKARALIE